MRIALTIAGSDSGAGAGIQADLKTFAAHGVYGLTAITAVTAQNTLGVSTFAALPADLVTAQIESVVADIGVHATKTGMLPNAAIVEAVAAAAEDLDIPLLVVDPVMIATSGDRLLDDEAIGAMKAELFSRALTVTPNIPEAEALTGISITTDEDRQAAARAIHAFGARTVIIKGGHYPTEDIRDLFFDGHDFHEFRGERVRGGSTHGTGCTFAAGLVAHLAFGKKLTDAIPLVQRYVAGAIRHAPGLGQGQGPIAHFWELH
jgi:hydroxymethylpyrimidine/phosphomethylpyrimidine kinase